MSYKYNFPPMRKLKSMSLDEQIDYIYGEAVEAQSALDSMRLNDSKENRIELAMEVCDVIHAAETALRIIENDLDVTGSSAASKVIKKNRVRGYYG